MVNLSCVQAYQECLRGQYQKSSDQHSSTTTPTIRMENIRLGFANMIRLKRALYRLVT